MDTSETQTILAETEHFRARSEPSNDKYGDWLFVERKADDEDWVLMYRSRVDKYFIAVDKVKWYEDWYKDATTPVPAEFEAVAGAAADWWVEELRVGGKKDNGDGFQSAFATYTMDSVTAEPEVVKLEKFREFLKNWIGARATRRHSWTGGNSAVKSDTVLTDLSCDYHPSVGLFEAANWLDIHDMRFPYKTNMWIYPGHVILSHGYRGKDQMIFGTPHQHQFVETSRTKDPEYESITVGFACTNCGVCTSAYLRDGKEDNSVEQVKDTRWLIECKAADA